MAAEPDPAEFAAFMDRIFREADVSMLIPLFFGMASAAARFAGPENRESPEEIGGERRAPPRERIILVNAAERRMLVIDGDSGLDSLFQELEGKQGQPPASKASIDAMPTVKIVGDGGSSECVICLEEFEVGGEAKEMPCKHRFHGGCIEKWLNRHGSCPVCRYMMPVEEETAAKKAEDDGGEGRRGDGQIRISIYVAGSGRTFEGSDQTPAVAGNDDMES